MRVLRSRDGVIRQDEFAKICLEGAAWRDLPVAEASRFGIGVGIEGRARKGLVSRPEAGAAHLVRIGFARDVVGQSGHAAGMGRGGAPEKRVTARSKLPQKKCTGLALPINPLRKSLKTRSAWTSARQKRCAAAES